jgi:uncharacterized membrane protein
MVMSVVIIWNPPNFVVSVIARSEATKQSILSLCGEMDCFVEFIIGRRFAPTRWLAMTVVVDAILA